MPLKIDDIKVKSCEKVVYATNKTTKLDCTTAIHYIKHSSAFGEARSLELW